MTDYVIGSIRTCEVCGKKFKVRNSGQKYCSKYCRGVAQERKRQERLEAKPLRICPLCGKEFCASFESQKYCSRACSARSVALRRRKGFAEQVPCQIRITKSIGVYRELQPVKGEIYPAMFCEGRNGNDFVILDIAGKKIVVRQGEYEIVE